VALRLLKLLALGAGTYWLTKQLTRRRINLSGKVVAITGGSRGLGLDLARTFGLRGARVALCGRDEATLKRAELILGEQGIPVYSAVCDVTESDQLERWLSDVERALGPIDVLVNSAGIISVGPFEEMTLEDFQKGMDTHFWAPLRAIRTVVPQMVRRGGGRIVNISSIGGLVGLPHFTPYAASKFALVGLSRALFAEMDRHQIRVTTVCPGLMRTGSPIHAQFKGQHRKEFAFFSLGAVTPLTAISSESAAEQIVSACEEGKPEVVLSPQARLLATAQGLLPALVESTLAWVNRLLPDPGGIGTQTADGRSSQSALSRLWMDTLNHATALRHNQ
jgi:NAD(P)-dependent dehydrogenase (short-subunit alcohol dehydrogenase family)